MIDWQPIETVPKDGRAVLLWLGWPFDQPRLARWYAPWGVWHDTVGHDVRRGDDEWGIGSRIPEYWAEVEPPVIE